MKTYIFYLLLLLNTNLFSSNEQILKPNNFTKEGYCIVNTSYQRYIGLLRFNTKKEFQTYCNGKMIFLYKKDTCKNFTMKNMKFNIYIKDKVGKYPFKIDQVKKVCGKTIIETIN